MSIFNGGRIGSNNDPTTSLASGVWTGLEQCDSIRREIWPGFVPPIVTDGLVLHLDAGNSASYPGSGTTWTDLSGNGNDGTLVNGVGYDSSNGGSLSLNGSSDYVRIPNVSISKNCSICFWFKDNNPGSWSDLFTFQTGSDGTASRVEKYGGIAYQYNWYMGGFASGTVLFNHLGTNFDYICLVFDAQNATCYQNAVQTAQSSSSNFGSTSFIDFGKRISIYNWNGNIAQVAIYNRALTPSEITQNFNAFMDRYFTSLLLRGDGANGSTTIVDSSPTPKTVTAYGDAQISTAQSKFGGSSIAFDGSGDYLTATDSSFAFGTGEFTVEFWVYILSTGVSEGIVVCGDLTSNSWQIGLGNGGVIEFKSGSSATNLSSSAISLSTWHHFVVARDSSNITRMFLNGTMVDSSTVTTNLSDSNLKIGINRTNQYYFHGYIDDLRITKGVARYTSNFTPPGAL